MYDNYISTYNLNYLNVSFVSNSKMRINIDSVVRVKSEQLIKLQYGFDEVCFRILYETIL